MKKVLLFSTIIAAMFGLASCGSEGEKVTLDYLAVQPKDGGMWGFVGPDGKMLYEDEFKNAPSSVANGVFIVEEEGGISVYEATPKKPTLIPGLEGLADAGFMNDGVIPIVRKNEHIKLVDKSGKEKLVLDFDVAAADIIRLESCSTDGIFIFETSNNLFGAINTSGKVVLAPNYTSLTYLGEGRFLGVWLKDDNYYLVNDKRKEIAKYDEKILAASKFINGKCLVYKGDDKIPGYINKKGEFSKLPSKIQLFTGVFDGKIFGFETEDHNVGIMNMEGEIIIRPKYEAVIPIPDDKFIVKNDDRQYFILNKDGEKEITLDEFRYLIPVNAMGFAGKFQLIGEYRKHRIDLYDYSGKEITQESFYRINIEEKKFVQSDYFNPEEIGKRLVSYIDDDGVNGIKFDSPVDKHLPKDAEAKDYSDKYEYDFSNANSAYQGYQWTLSITGHTDGPIATPIYTTKTETGWFSTYTRQVLSGYKFNPRVKITSFTIAAESKRDFLEGAYKAVEAALKEKGFKEVPQDEEEGDYDAMMYQRGPVLVAVGSYYEDGYMLWIGVSTESGSQTQKVEDVADSAVADSAVASE